jgi:hypothetical protein
METATNVPTEVVSQRDESLKIYVEGDNMTHLSQILPSTVTLKRPKMVEQECQWSL